jgi:hypothetical protein
MDIIVEMRFGSHLYGTATAQSDLDYKAVYVPEARDILLQRVKNTITQSPEKQAGDRNAPGDIDREAHSLQRYLELLAEGQTMALDMLFAPAWAMTRPPAPLWTEIQENAARLVTRRASAFLRYCRQQANKYGIKGSRVSSARLALSALVMAEENYGTTARLRGLVRTPPLPTRRDRLPKLGSQGQPSRTSTVSAVVSLPRRWTLSWCL